MPRQALTSRFVSSLNPPARVEYWDEVQPGLVLRAGPRSKAWGVVFTGPDGVRRRQALGEFPAMTLEAARRAARVTLGAVASGAVPKPVAAVVPRGETVAALAEEFLQHHASRLRTGRQYKMILDAHVLPIIGGVKAAALSRREVRGLVERLEADRKNRMAARVLQVVRKLLSWAVQRDRLEVNVATGIKPSTAPVKRDRVLTPTELAELAEVLVDPKTPMGVEMRDLLRLLLLTGQRVAEVAGMRMAELDLAAGLWTLPGERTKNGLVHLVPLSPAALAIVRRRAEAAGEDGLLFAHRAGKPFGSSSVAHALSRAWTAREVSRDWTPHDLRRTCATGMAALGVQPHVIEAVLNHVSGAKAGVAGIYNRHAYAEEKAAALMLWAEKQSLFR